MSFEQPKFEKPFISSAEEEKTEKPESSFQNPDGYWKHHGSFSVELVSGASKDRIPKDVNAENDLIKVSQGRVEQQMGGIVFFSQEKHFRWPYREIKAIRDGDGRLLWVNDEYRSEVLGTEKIKEERTEEAKEVGQREKRRSTYSSAGGPQRRMGEAKREARRFQAERRREMGE